MTDDDLERRHGVLPTARLVGLGWTSHAIASATRAGTLVRLRPGWLARRDAHPRVVVAVRVARAALRDPHLPIRWSRELGVEVDWAPAQYARAY